MNTKSTSLFEALLHIKTADEMEQFFKDLCTPAEIEAFQERWRVCQLLEQENLSYRQIHALTGASLTTIGRVARFLKDEPYKGYRNVLNKITKRKIE